MSLGRFVPIVCLLLVLASAASATADALTTGPWPHSEFALDRLPLGAALTALSLLMVIWLILDSCRGERALAKAALALLLAGAAAWIWIVTPAFWDSLGLDDCLTDCIRAEHITARADVAQGKWAVMVANTAAASCVAASIWRRFHRAAP